MLHVLVPYGSFQKRTIFSVTLVNVMYFQQWLKQAMTAMQEDKSTHNSSDFI